MRRNSRSLSASEQTLKQELRAEIVSQLLTQDDIHSVLRTFFESTLQPELISITEKVDTILQGKDNGFRKQFSVRTSTSMTPLVEGSKSTVELALRSFKRPLEQFEKSLETQAGNLTNGFSILFPKKKDGKAVVNDQGNAVESGRDGRTYYCGQSMVQAGVGHDGYCGPHTGPQCESCQRYEAQQAVGDRVSPTATDRVRRRDQFKSLLSSVKTGVETAASSAIEGITSPLMSMRSSGQFNSEIVEQADAGSPDGDGNIGEKVAPSSRRRNLAFGQMGNGDRSAPLIEDTTSDGDESAYSSDDGDGRRRTSYSSISGRQMPKRSVCTGSSKASLDPLRRPKTQNLDSDDVEQKYFSMGIAEDKSIRRKLHEVAKATTFHFVIGVIIIMNSISVGMETDHMARHSTHGTNSFFHLLDWAFCIFFMGELGIRVFVSRLRFVTNPRERIQNIFDASVIVLQIVGQALVLTVSFDRKGFFVVNLFRISPLLRLARVFRLFNAYHLFPELRLLFVSIVDSLKSFSCALILIYLVIYTIAVYLTQAATNVKLSESEQTEELLLLFGSLDRSMLTMYEVISDGIHWHEALDPFRDHYAWMPLAFALYTAFTSLCVMNIITGVFVGSAIETASADNRRILIEQMRSAFHEADVDHSGTISRAEFENHMETHQMQNFLRAAGLDKSEALDLFALLDDDNNGEIEPEEFVNGCMRVQGVARAMDLAMCMEALRRLIAELKEQANDQRDLVIWLARQLLEPEERPEPSHIRSEGSALVQGRGITQEFVDL